MTFVVLALYFAAIVAVAVASGRLFRGTGEDFFVASRSIGPALLLVSLFGAHMTSFSLLGASAEAYQRGIGVFALMASSSAVVAPLLFLLLGTRVWALGKRHGFVTQIQYFRARFESDALGIVLFVVLVGLLVPYLLIGLFGAGLTLAQITGGVVPDWAGSLIVVLVVLGYTTYGGMRGTMWVNAFQTSVFLVVGAITLGVVVRALGGLDAAVDRVATTHPELLGLGTIGRGELLTYLLIPASVGMFPHLFQHWLTAGSGRAFRVSIVGYPLCIAAVWLPSILLGVLARADFPALAPREASTVLVRLIDLHAPELLSGLLAAGVLSAVFSSFDSQVLALGTMFTHDVVRHYRFHDRMSPRQEVAVGRAFVVVVLLGAFALSRLVTPAIFKLGIWCFTGFAALLPVVVAALFWRRATKVGAILATVVVAAAWSFLVLFGGRLPAAWLAGGALPVAALTALSSLAMVIGSLVSRPPSEATLAAFFAQPTPSAASPSSPRAT